MKQILKNALTLCMVLVMTLGLAGNFAPVVEAKANPNAKTVTIAPKNVTLTVGQKTTLKATIKPKKAKKNSKRTWKSSNKSVASVSKKGKVTAKKAGRTAITLTVGGNKKKATCIVTVKAKPAPPKRTPPKGKSYKNQANLTGKVSFSGSTSVYPAIAALTEDFKKRSKKVTISINNVTGSGAGLADANKGTVSFGMRSADYASSSDNKGRLNAYQIAWDGVAVVVNNASVASSLSGYISLSELAYVYRGSPAPASGRKAALDKLNPIDRENGSGTRDCFQSVLGIGNNRVGGITIANTTDQMKSMISRTTNGIGYMSLGSVGNMSTLSIGNSSGAAVKPSEGAVANGSYRLSRPFLLLRLKTRKLSAAEKEFLKFSLSDQGQQIISKSNFVPLTGAQRNAELAKVK